MRSVSEVCVYPLSSLTPSMRKVRSTSTEMMAPIFCSTATRSMISGSVAAPDSSVLPSASTAANKVCSVAPTDGYGRWIFAPFSPFGAVMWMPSAWSLSTSAPSLRRVSRWKSMGRPPMLQPPSAGMKASPRRCSSGPEKRIGMREEPARVSTSATDGISTWEALMVTMPLSPLTSTSTPCRRSRSDTTCTSRISGTFLSTEVPGASRAATMALLTKFFAPRTLMVPFNGLPPSTCRTSSLFSATVQPLFMKNTLYSSVPQRLWRRGEMRQKR